MIKYKEGYEYQLVEAYSYQTEICGFDIDTDFLRLETDGKLTMKKGYAWDGPSGPTVNTKNSMRGSLVHDGLYQLMAIQPLLLVHRPYADDQLYTICCEDGMSSFRAYIWLKGVNWFGKGSAEEDDEILEAP